jgi:hypothetical protein
LSPGIQTTPSESRALEGRLGHYLVGVGWWLGRWYQSWSLADRQE